MVVFPFFFYSPYWLPAPDPAEATRFAEELRRSVTVDATMGHLRALQDIADAQSLDRQGRGEKTGQQALFQHLLTPQDCKLLTSFEDIDDLVSADDADLVNAQIALLGQPLCRQARDILYRLRRRAPVEQLRKGLQHVAIDTRDASGTEQRRPARRPA